MKVEAASPRISVIVPAYNQAHFLECALESLLNQTVVDWEAIVVDDGSTDNTSQVVAAFDDSRIRYHYQDNQGLSAARNTGIRLALGEIVAFLDSDDYYSTEALAHHLKVFEQNSTAALHVGSWSIVDERENVIEAEVVPSAQTFDSLILGNRLHVGSVAVRASAVHEAGMFDETLRACEDWDLWMRIALNGGNLISSSGLVGHYRMHGNQMTRDAARMRDAAVTVLTKLSGDSRLQRSHKDLLNESFARVYANAAARWYRQGDINDAKHDLVKSIEFDESLLSNNGVYFVDLFRGWANDVRTPNAEKYLTTVFTNLPAQLAVLSKQQSDVMVGVHIDAAVQAIRNRQWVVSMGRMLQSFRHRIALWMLMLFARETMVVLMPFKRKQ